MLTSVKPNTVLLRNNTKSLYACIGYISFESDENLVRKFDNETYLVCLTLYIFYTIFKLYWFVCFFFINFRSNIFQGFEYKI